MKKIYVLLLLCTIGSNCQTPIDYSNEANNYALAFNNRNIEEYVNHFIPSYYGGKDEYKKYMIDAYERMLEDDDRRLEEINVVHSIEKGDNIQVLFSAKHGHSEAYFIGISNSGNKLKFSDLFSSNLRIDQVTEKIPDLDKSFYDLIEPGWENVIRFEVGKEIPELDWTNISGKKITSGKIPDQVTVLNFWHTTCAPCIKEIPELNELVSRYPEISFIAPISDINVDYLKDQFLAKHNFDYEIAIVDGKKYNVYSFPKHIIIRNSEVIEIIDGYSPGNISKLDLAIKSAMP